MTTQSILLMFLSLAILMTYAFCQTPVPSRCSDFSASCAKCNLSPMNCRYVWTAEGFYNSSTNGRCLDQAVVDQLLWYNEYNKTVWAYGLKESEVATPRGQYLLSKRDSSQLYEAVAVLCWDRHLCYCAPPPPAPPNRVIVIITYCATGLPFNNAVVSLTGANLTSSATRNTNSSGTTEYYPLGSGSYFTAVSAAGFYPNSTAVGTLGYNTTVTVRLCLAEIPCRVTVFVYDIVTNLTITGALVTPNSAALAPQTTDAAGSTAYTFITGTATQVTGSYPNYQSDTRAIDCSRNGTTIVRLYLRPILSNIVITVTDCRTGRVIPTATVAITGSGTASSGVDAISGQATFSNVNRGSYNAGASAPGYTSNSTGTFAVDFNQTVNRAVCLNELPCIVTVTVYDTSTNATLNAAIVTLLPGNIQSQTTGASGAVTYTILYDLASGAQATKVGYTTSSATFACSRNGTANVIIWLSPVLNQVTIIVRDIRTDQPIPSAFVLLTGYSNRQVNSTGGIYYGSVAGGSYTALATAAGYSSNSTSFDVTFNQTIVRVIYLTELPCVLTVTVYDTSTNATLNGAVVTLLPGNIQSQTTGASGAVTYSILFDLASSAQATKVGYTTSSATFACSRNGTANVIIWLSPVLNQVTIIVRDIRNDQPIPSAFVVLTGFTSRQVNSTGGVYYGSVAGGAYTATASASGYSSNSTSFDVTFNQTIVRVIYLRELPCQVFVTVYDTSTNGTLTGATVDLGNALTQVTGASGQVTWTFNFDSATLATATKVGYTTASSAINCARNGTVNIFLWLSPVLNDVIIEVRDIRTNRIIPFAFVTLTPGQFSTPRPVNAGNGQVAYGSVPGGAYSALATATGYYSNSTSFSVSFNQSFFTIIYLIEYPCTLIVNVVDNSTGLALSGALVALNNVTITTQTTSASGQVTWTFYTEQATSVSASKEFYSPASSAFTCGLNRTVTVTLILVPIPSSLTIQVLDGRTNLPITFAFVSLAPFSGPARAVNASAMTTYFPLAAGTYTASASATGYTGNSTGALQLQYNQTLFAIIYLYELPCVLTVFTYDNSTRQLLSDVTVSTNSAALGNQVTTATGFVTYNLRYDLASLVNGSKVGYLSASSTFNCSRNGTARVDLYLVPLPNRIIIQVKDIETGANITTATVILGPTNNITQRVSADFALATFFPVAFGDYIGYASAPTYYSNSTAITGITYNETRFVIIYLRHLPCVLQVTVLLRGTTTPIPQANITFDDYIPGQTFPSYLTDNDGRIVVSQNGLAPAIVIARKEGFSNASEEYDCQPGTIQNVTLFLDRIYQITVWAVDSTSQVPLASATITLNNNVVRKVSPRGPAYRIEEVNNLPITYTTFAALAPGYLDASRSNIRFTLNNTEAFISLAPVAYTVGFAVSQLFEDGNQTIIEGGVLTSGYVPGANEVYVPASSNIGGSVTKLNADDTVLLSQYGTTTVFGNRTQFLAIYVQITPTSQSRFLIVPTNITRLSTNFNNTVGSSYEIIIPEYYQTDNRQLTIPLPYKVNSGYIITRVSVFASDAATPSVFPQGGFIGMSFYNAPSSLVNYVRYNGDLAGVGKVVYEFLVDIGNVVYNFAPSYQTEYFDIDRTGFLNPANGQIITNSATWQSTLFGYRFPTNQWLNSTFVFLPNGQWARRRNSVLYTLYDFRLVYQVGQPSKKRTA